MHHIIVKQARQLLDSLLELDGDTECGQHCVRWKRLISTVLTSSADIRIPESHIAESQKLSNVYWDRLHSANHCQISRQTRLGFAISMHTSALLSLSAGDILECIECLDKIIIMVDCPILRNEVYELAELAQSQLQMVSGSDQGPSLVFPEIRLSNEPHIQNQTERIPIAEVDDWNDILGQSVPRIIENAFADWTACEKWTGLNNLMNRLGPDRLVPVELGSKYTDQNWTQKLMTVRTFFRDHLAQESDIKGYMAQHDLFHQMPHLLADINIPEYFKTRPVSIHAWIGPCGTVSPLHSDPYDNLFVQVVGYKYFWLCSHKESANVYPYSADDQMANTSQVDVDTPDLDRFPRFANIQYTEALLKPGDALFIPCGWWHHVKSLSISVSVSFWSNKS